MVLLSPVGVATEYLKDTSTRDYVNYSSLIIRKSNRIDGRTYQKDLTSGGAADLPDVFVRKSTHSTTQNCMILGTDA
jgi:hypothetical protein